MSPRDLRTIAALGLQAAALVALVAALLGVQVLDPRGRDQVLVLLDRSASMPREAVDEAAAALDRTLAARGLEPQWLDFAARPASRPVVARPAHAASSSPAVGDRSPDPSGTAIEAALQAALATHARRPLAGLVIVSDGWATAGDTARALANVRDAGVPLHWVPVGRPPPASRIASLHAPASARAGQSVPVQLRIETPPGRALRVEAQARGGEGAVRTASQALSAAGEIALPLGPLDAGVWTIDVALRDAASGAVLDARDGAAAVDVAAPAPLLVLQGGADASLARALRAGGWALQVAPAVRADALAAGLQAYRAVVLDDVAVTDASPRFWSALTSAVQSRGLGLLVLGGERSFARGGYAGSALESVLPLESRPAALEQPLSIVFAVDKSGSMGRGSGGVDRFALAQRAVIESARGLGDRDALGLLVFDVVPRTLIPLGPAAAARPALDSDWPVSPQGGTAIGPALEAALGALERGPAGRRMLVLVTDGFVETHALPRWRERLERARVELVALAVGPDADAPALRRLIGPDRGVVLQVDQAAELPTAMRAGLEQQRARVERGVIEARQTAPLPFAPGRFEGWPPVAAHAVTVERPGANVAVRTARGEPLVATHAAGLGRVAALTAGLGPWSPRWLAWKDWPRLAGGLTEWVGSGGALTVLESTAAQPGDWTLAIEAPRSQPVADAPALAQGLAGGAVMLADTPRANGLRLMVDNPAPGRLKVEVPDHGPGLYAFTLTSPDSGAHRHVLLRRAEAEGDAWGVNPALDRWRREGLIGERAAFLESTRRGPGGERPIDRGLVALALALSLAAVIVDRWTRAQAGRGTPRRAASVDRTRAA